jgi:hypothetical protein
MARTITDLMATRRAFQSNQDDRAARWELVRQREKEIWGSKTPEQRQTMMEIIKAPQKWVAAQAAKLRPRSAPKEPPQKRKIRILRDEMGRLAGWEEI